MKYAPTIKNRREIIKLATPDARLPTLEIRFGTHVDTLLVIHVMIC